MAVAVAFLSAPTCCLLSWLVALVVIWFREAASVVLVLAPTGLFESEVLAELLLPAIWLRLLSDKFAMLVFILLVEASGLLVELMQELIMFEPPLLKREFEIELLLGAVLAGA